MKKYWIGLLIIGLAGCLFLVSRTQAMDLNESIDAAIQTNPTVAAAQKKASAAGAKLGQAVSAFFPALDLNGNYGQSYSSPSTVQISVGGVTQNYRIGSDSTAANSGVQAALSQPLFVASLYPGYGLAKKGADSAEEQYQQTVIDISFNVTQSYFGVLKSIKMEKLMSDALATSKAHREQVQSMLNAGMATKADLLQSKVREANDNVALIQSKYAIDLSKDTFNNVLGVDMQRPVELKDIGFTGKVNNIPEYAVLLSTAYDNRPDWKMYLLETGMSEEQVKIAQSEYWPNLVLNANTGNQLTQYPTFQSSVNSWQIAGAGTWTLFDSFGREGRINEAAENLAAQKAQVEQFKNNIALEVHDAYLNLKSALEVVIATQQAVDSAEESLKVSTSRYDSGMGTNVDVLDAQVSLTQSLTDNLNALFNVEIAKAKINQAVGKTMLQ
ncbi:MAG: TolC family protein [Candidatus Margulisiibacteriota bacterium]